MNTAQRTRRPRTRPLPREPLARPSRSSSSRTDERLRADLFAILLGLLGVLLAVGLFRPGGAGVAGSFMVHLTRFWMGSVVQIAPVLFIIAALGLALDYRRATNAQMVWGALGLMVVLFGTVHLLGAHHVPAWESTGARLRELLHKPHALITNAPDGGFFGALIVSVMAPLGHIGSLVTLGAIAIASLLLVSELTLRGIAERAHERGRIAAEAAKNGAGAVRDRAREAASNLPARRQPEKPLFLDVGRSAIKRTPALEEEEEQQPVRKSIFARKKPEAAEPAETALVPVRELEAWEAEPVPQKQQRVRNTGRAARREPMDPGEFIMPPLELLNLPTPRPKRSADDTDANIAILENTLAQFNIEATVVEIADGPSVTRYEIRLGEGVRVKKILDLADNIAMSLAAMSVRVEAPIPGKSAIGIEVPKKVPQVVSLRECIESAEFKDFNSKVAFVLGKDVGGNVRCADLARMPHLLVAGATNSGKSVCLNVLIASMLYRARPDELKMIMIDPKRVELTLFEGIPHLVHPVVKDVKQAAGILRWVLKEMDRRYDLFAHVMTRNVDNYNEKMAKEPEKRLPFLVVVIDELADLMMQQGPEVEQSICRLAQLARATGIHLVIATQRPSVDVITGLIKANVPSRISFSVTSQIDSRTILDGKGAESLVGRGDMLFKPVDANKPVRIQGAFLHESEVEKIVEHLKAQGRPEYIAEALAVDHGAYGVESKEEVEDELFESAARFIVTTGHASTSMIQRKFKIGYTRAARLVDMMEARGIVGALDGAKPREIMMSRDGIDTMFRQVRDSVGSFGPADDDEDDIIEMEETTGPGGDPFVDE